MMRKIAGLALALGLLFAPASKAEDLDASTLAGLVRDLRADAYAQREAATARLIEIGVPALPTLSAALEANDVELRFRVRFVVEEILRRLEPPQNRVRLQVRDALERLTGKGSFGTGDPEYMEIVEFGRAAIPPLQELLLEYDADHVNRIYAGAALAQVAAKEDVLTLVAYLSDSNVHVRIHVGSAMNQLTGETYDYDSNGGPDNWSKAKEKYRTWWSDHSEAILREAAAQEAQGTPRSGPSTRTGGG